MAEDINAIRQRHEAEAKLFATITPAAGSGLPIPKAVQAHIDRGVLLAEAGRLRDLAAALRRHGMTTWADSSAGTGRAGGQVVTTTVHTDVVDHLLWYLTVDPATQPGRRLDVTEAADEWERAFLGTVRLDAAPAKPIRRGPDGRPLAIGGAA